MSPKQLSFCIIVSDTLHSPWKEMPPQLRHDTQANLQTLMDWSTCVRVIKNNSVSSAIVSHPFDKLKPCIVRRRIARKDILIVEKKYMASTCQQTHQKNYMETCTGQAGIRAWNLARHQHIMHLILVVMTSLIGKFSWIFQSYHIFFSRSHRYEELLHKIPAVADMFKTRFCYLFPAGAKSLIETSRECVFFLFFLCLLLILILQREHSILRRLSGWKFKNSSIFKLSHID